MRITKVEIVALTVVFAISLALIVPAFPMAQTKPRYFPKCTSMLIGKDATADGSVLMGHTEDVGDDDCMHLLYHPRMSHMAGEVIHFTWEDVPQVPVTYAYTADEVYDPWLYGGGGTFMNGINEHGVTLSSNVFWCKEEMLPPNTGLTYQHIGQLIMERCKTSREAVDLLAWCVETYGFAGFSPPWPYLTFVTADANEGWIVEVTPHHWVAKRCPDDGAIFYANEIQIQIQTEWDLACPDLIDYAIAQGWYDPASGKPFNFKEAYWTTIGETWWGFRDGGSRLREWRQKAVLGPKLGSITLQDVMRVYRDHYEGTDYYYLPHTAPTDSPPYPICAPWTHACEIYHLRSDMPSAMGCVMWISGSSSCTGVFTPVYAGNRGDTPEEWMLGQDHFDPNSAWWTFEQIQRIVAGYENTVANWEATWPKIRARFDKIEKQEFVQTAQLEQTAIKLWLRGEKEMTLKLLTRYTYTRLHINFLTARELLHWAELKRVAA